MSLYVFGKTAMMPSVNKMFQVKLYRVTKLLLALPRKAKRVILIVFDYTVSAISLFLSLVLYYGDMEQHISPILLAFYACIPIFGLYFIGFYRPVTRIFFDAEMRGVLHLFLAITILVSLMLYFDWLHNIPRSVPSLFLFLLLVGLWFSRLTMREILVHWQNKRQLNSVSTSTFDKVIIYGAGSSGKALFEALSNSPRYQVVAFVDDDTRLIGGYLLGKEIFAANSLTNLIAKKGVSQVFLAMPSISLTRKKQIIQSLSDISVQIKHLPSLTDIVDGKVTVSTMRSVNILDVLDRETVAPNAELLAKNIYGKNVLVTGAGGSIGSEICRQILKNRPRRLVLLELSEYALYSIHQELLSKKKQQPEKYQVEIIALIGNVTNEAKLNLIFKKFQVQTIYHAAAYKHVPIVENNPFEGVINNAKGTYHCARAAIAADVETFVLISTDKAVRPTNIMGASKRLAELICQALSQEVCQTACRQEKCTRISMVRFGNVLGSSGSVVPLFTRQIASGGPITVTHPEVTRYFMTIPEAASLVIQAGAMATGGEVFVLDMGEPVKIIDLAKRMIYLTGCKLKDETHPDGDMEIVVTGLRPGEKLYEELIIGDDNIESTQHPLIQQAIEESFPLVEIENMLSQLTTKAQPHDVEWLKEEFKYFVEGYHESSVPS